VLTIAVLVGLAWTYRDTLRLSSEQQGGADRALIPTLARWSRLQPGPWPKGALFGDSLAGCPTTTVAKVVGHPAPAHGLVFMLDATFAGMHPLQFYALLGDVLAGRPTAVVVEVNFPALAASVHSSESAVYRQMSRKLPLAAIPRLWGPLAREGMGLFDPLIFRAFAALDMLYVVDGIRERSHQALEDWGTAVDAALDLPVVRFLELPGFDAARARAVFGDDQTHSPSVQVFRMIAHDLRAAGVPVLFYVSPVNVHVLDDLGVRRTLDLPAHVEAVRVAIGATANEWLDLHDLLPATAFKDAWGHMLDPGCEAVASTLLTRLGVVARVPLPPPEP